MADSTLETSASVAVTAFWIAGARAKETMAEAPVITEPLAAPLLAAGRVHYDKLVKFMSSPVMNVVVCILHLLTTARALLSYALQARPLAGLVAAKTFVVRTVSQSEAWRFHWDHIRRTQFIDVAVRRAVVEQGVRQVVLIGAGLDTRAFRLLSDASMPAGVRVYECDHPSLFAHKEAVLKAEGASAVCRTVVPLEYAEVTLWDVKAQEAGFDRHAPAVFILEGLIMYLPWAEQQALIHKVAANAAAGSVLTGDIISSYPVIARTGQKFHSPVGKDIVGFGTLPDDFESLLDAAGFTRARTVVEARSDALLHLGGPPLPCFERGVMPQQRYFFQAAKA